MDLILWRHADAEERTNGDDLQRLLTPKGVKQAEKMAAWLRERLPDDHIVLTSQAARAQLTARALTSHYKVLPELNPDSGFANLLTAADWPDGRQAVVIVGHQPTLGEVASFLLAGDASCWSIRKGAVWWISHRIRDQADQTVLKVAMSPEML
ncbi:phosphohistidine phosphatase [Chitinivorax tropicus]|uniref:Phosphohistidine phosphatase n=1 Tax=Chitinivorax tropicus TaxID=714531 RepID=A0A840MF96_9PROT|nr:histidine phosphatase family protein [Chitinivorax tropicus]MBB5017070.1 phosphohistidine phosphatase [Chitinivorax tropicus]